MTKYIILLVAAVVGLVYADEVIQQLLNRVPAIHELSKPTLKFLKNQNMNNEVVEIEKQLTNLDHLVKNGNHDTFGTRAQLLGAERVLIALMKNALIKRSELLFPKADQAIHSNPNSANEIKKEKIQLEQLTSTLKTSINQYDNNIKIEKEIIVVQDKLEYLITKFF